MSKSRENSEISREGRLVARFGPFTIDERRRQIARRDAVIHLTPKAFDLLLVLVSEAPRVLTKRELHQRLWPDSFVTDASLAELVKELRRAHARITIAGGQALLEDLGSKNGTTVRLARVAGPVRLRDSDRISFGGTPAVFRSSATGMSTETHASGTASRGDRGDEAG